MNFFDHKDLGNHLLQVCPKVVKHPVYVYVLQLVEPYRETALSEVDGPFMTVFSSIFYLFCFFVSGNCSLIICEHRVYYCYKIALLE
jgi:hypothetical protein